MVLTSSTADARRASFAEKRAEEDENLVWFRAGLVASEVCGELGAVE